MFTALSIFFHDIFFLVMETMINGVSTSPLLFQSHSLVTVICQSHDLLHFSFSQKEKIPNCHLSCFTLHQQVPFWRFLKISQSFLWHCCLSCLTNQSRFLLGRRSGIFVFQWSKHTNVQSVFNQKIISRMRALKLIQGIYSGIYWAWFNHLKGGQPA